MHGIYLYAISDCVYGSHIYCREKNAPSTTPLALQDLIEKVMLLKKAVEKDTHHRETLMLVGNLENIAVCWLLKDVLIQP